MCIYIYIYICIHIYIYTHIYLHTHIYIYCLWVIHGLCPRILIENVAQGPEMVQRSCFSLVFLLLFFAFMGFGFRVGFSVFGLRVGFLSFGFNVLRSIVSEIQKQRACAGVCAMGRSRDGVVVETAGKLQEFATHLDINIAKTWHCGIQLEVLQKVPVPGHWNLQEPILERRHLAFLHIIFHCLVVGLSQFRGSVFWGVYYDGGMRWQGLCFMQSVTQADQPWPMLSDLHRCHVAAGRSNFMGAHVWLDSHSNDL